MTVFDKIAAMLRRQNPNDLWKDNPSSPTDVNVTLLAHAAITCPCGGMALPTQVKGNEYRCVRCDEMMNNINYNLGQREIEDDNWVILPKDDRHVLNMAYYDDAFAKIQQRYGKKH